MPFIEITGFDQKEPVRRQLAAGVTRALAAAFGIDEEIVTVYFHPVDAAHYAHAGALAPPGPERTFIKVHAFARDVERKRAAARHMCEAAAATLQVPPKNVVIYFFDRPAHDVAHGGVLASDMQTTQAHP
jgi:phenylpyruvate tautomerase PptA (4-oxalocrotonate tautomerase family)